MDHTNTICFRARRSPKVLTPHQRDREAEEGAEDARLQVVHINLKVGYFNLLLRVIKLKTENSTMWQAIKTHISRAAVLLVVFDGPNRSSQSISLDLIGSGCN
jgi:hypothetical protein